jgi:hypothetical protein
MARDRAPQSVHPLTRGEWRAWLEQHHANATGVWLITYKKATGKPRVAYEEAVEEALCFGWIDSKGNKLDDERSMLWFAPRRPGSGWSKPNKERVERLLAAGLGGVGGACKNRCSKGGRILGSAGRGRGGRRKHDDGADASCRAEGMLEFSGDGGGMTILGTKGKDA